MLHDMIAFNVCVCVPLDECVTRCLFSTEKFKTVNDEMFLFAFSFSEYAPLMKDLKLLENILTYYNDRPKSFFFF